MAQSSDNQAFEAQVFHTETAQPVQLGELSAQEMKETEGALLPLVAWGLGGGAVGAWANHYDSYRKTGQPASVSSTLKATGSGIATGASLYGGGRAAGIAKNIRIDGPSKGFKYGNGRVFGVRYNSRPVFRLDNHPNPSPTRWHMHIAPNIKAHRPWHAPWKKY